MKLYAFLFGLVVILYSCSNEQVEQLDNEVDQEEVKDDHETMSPFESAEAMKFAINSGETKPDFYANFTEPFFTIYFVNRQALIVRMDGENEMYELLMAFNPRADKQEIIIGEVTARILKEEGSDGMSDLNYPFSVEYGEFVGGGATEKIVEE